MNCTDRSSPIYRKCVDFTGIRKDFTGIRKVFGKRSERVHHVLCPFGVFGKLTEHTVHSGSVRAVRKMF